MREGLDRIGRAAAIPRIAGAVRGSPLELDEELHVGLDPFVIGLGLVSRVPDEHRVDILENAVADHEDPREFTCHSFGLYP